MKTSEKIDKIIPALLKAQKKIGAAKKGSSNPFYKSTYADLGAIMEVCKEIMNEEGILIFQNPETRKNETTGEVDNFMETTFFCGDQFISGDMKLILSKQDMQQLGGAQTYSRRYGRIS